MFWISCIFILQSLFAPFQPFYSIPPHCISLSIYLWTVTVQRVCTWKTLGGTQIRRCGSDARRAWCFLRERRQAPSSPRYKDLILPRGRAKPSAMEMLRRVAWAEWRREAPRKRTKQKCSKGNPYHGSSFFLSTNFLLSLFFLTKATFPDSDSSLFTSLVSFWSTSAGP